MKKLTVYANDQIIENEDGTYEWISNSGETETFLDASDLLNFAEEDEPQTYDTIEKWISNK